MKPRTHVFTIATIVGVLLVSGCASHSEMREVRSEVATLRALTEAANENAKKALDNSATLRSELASARLAAESADKNSAATRAMMEQLNARLDGSARPLK